jgi:hypothetical protein
VFWLTPPHEMPPKHRQPNTPRPKLAGTAYKALVDLPCDGSDPFTNGRDRKVDGTDERSAANVPQRVFTVGTPAAASPLPAPTGEPPLRIWHRGLIADIAHAVVNEEQLRFGHELHFQYSAASLYTIEQAHIEIQWCLITFKDNVNNNFDNLLQKTDMAWTENTALREAYHTFREETAALKAAVDSLTQKIDEQCTILAPPSLDLSASPSTMEEMTMQLSIIQHDIQDVLEAVCNPPSKRKRCTSNQDAEPTMPTN